MNWDDLKVFLATARAGKISTASKALAIDQSTVSRRIRSLEAAIATRLFHKSPAGYVLTEAGQGLLQHAERLESGVLKIEDDYAQLRKGLNGRVRIGAPEGFSAFYLTPMIGAFLSMNPGLSIDMVSAPRWISLSRRDADIAISLSFPNSGRQKVRKLMDFSLRLYGLKQDAQRKQQSIDAIGVGFVRDLFFDEDDELDQFLSYSGQTSLRLNCTSVLAQVEAVRAGFGPGVLADFLAVRYADLEPLEPQRPPLVLPLWIRTQEDGANVSRISATVDFIVSECQRNKDTFLKAGNPAIPGRI